MNPAAGDTGPRQLNRPPALSPGGTIGIAAPASPIDPDQLARGVEALRAAGYRVVIGERAGGRYGHLAGGDAERAADLNELFAREDVDAIVCARGGSGSIRLLDRLDYDLVARSPKPFVGYSELTSVQLALLHHARLPSVFGPMVQPEFARGLAAPAREWLFRLIGRADPPGVPESAVAERRARALVGGQARGPLVGGTLSLVAAAVGTPFLPEFDGCLFFFEDIHEHPARIERYLAQMRYAGLLERAAGFVVGDAIWEAGDEERARFLPLEQVLRDLLVPFGKPTLVGFPTGHVPDPVALPQGIFAEVDADLGTVEVVEAVVV